MHYNYADERDGDDYGAYDSLHELANDYPLPNKVKSVIRTTAEVHKYTYCNLMHVHHVMVKATSSITGRHHPVVQYASFCK